MEYNIYNEVVCDFNCKECEVRNICTDRIDFDLNKNE